MRKFILLSAKSWHDDMFVELSARSDESWKRIRFKDEFNLDTLSRFRPEKIFIPHWSYIIPNEIWINFDCVVFHMTDLPFGRGGSPLQNLIVRGLKSTKISAIKVNEGIDTGDVYLKSDLDLSGTAKEIFTRSVPIIHRMISSIIDFDMVPLPQSGEVLQFVRRIPEQSEISSLSTIVEVYDHIRMLDCEGYPNAFLETLHFKYEFTNCVVDTDNSLKANVRIVKK